jgi:hypothetical protein
MRTRDEPTALTSEDVQEQSPAAGGTRPRSAPQPAAGTTRPMYDRMAVDGHGRVWLRIGQQRGADERWVVFDRNGALTASLRMIENPRSVPPRTEPWFGSRIVRFGVALNLSRRFAARRLTPARYEAVVAGVIGRYSNETKYSVGPNWPARTLAGHPRPERRSGGPRRAPPPRYGVR